MTYAQMLLFLVQRIVAFSLCTRTTSCTSAGLSCGNVSATVRLSSGTPGSGPWEKGELRPPPVPERHESKRGN